MWMPVRGKAGWTVMAHANAFLTYNQQGGPRGAGKFESQNWLMLMEERRVDSATVNFRQMFSAEPLTAPHPGFPELFQTGETYHGRPLVDHQHPHDVIGELAALITVPVFEKVSWLIYGGAAGEPALGPTAFTHRASAMELPPAPLGHHLQDSTHIAFGVVTTGLVMGPVKVEGSAFNGREPDERRWNFDFGPLDSFSGRVAVALGRNWTAQYSYGHLVHPEALEAGNINRQTASVNYNRPMRAGYWTSTLLWGRNHKAIEGTNQNGFLLESALNFRLKNYVFTRLELVDKDELFPDVEPRQSFRIGAYSFGAERDLVQSTKGRIGVGAAMTFYSKPSALDAVYGDNPVSFQVFLHFRPPLMKH